jgi:hypothetical protein
VVARRQRKLASVEHDLRARHRNAVPEVTSSSAFADTDRVAKRIRDDIAPKVAADVAYQNAKENTPHTARLAHDQALGKVMQHLLSEAR